jgi:hypothetical protein
MSDPTTTPTDPFIRGHSLADQERRAKRLFGAALLGAIAYAVIGTARGQVLPDSGATEGLLTGENVGYVSGLVVVVTGAIMGVAKVWDLRKRAKEAEEAPTQRAHERIDELERVIAELLADVHPRAEQKHLAWRKDVSKLLSDLQTTVTGLQGQQADEVRELLERAIASGKGGSGA